MTKSPLPPTEIHPDSLRYSIVDRQIKTKDGGGTSIVEMNLKKVEFYLKWRRKWMSSRSEPGIQKWQFTDIWKFRQSFWSFWINYFTKTLYTKITEGNAWKTPQEESISNEVTDVELATFLDMRFFVCGLPSANGSSIDNVKEIDLDNINRQI